MKFVAALVLSLSILCSSTVMAKEEINWPANANYVLFVYSGQLLRFDVKTGATWYLDKNTGEWVKIKDKLTF